MAPRRRQISRAQGQLGDRANDVDIAAVEFIGAAECIIGAVEVAHCSLELAEFYPIVGNIVFGTDELQQCLARADEIVRRRRRLVCA